MVRSKSYKHHPIECEVHEAHQYEVVEQEELSNIHVEPNHRVKYYAIYQRLD